MGSKERNSSMRSDSLVSSERLVTQMVADSSVMGTKNRIRHQETDAGFSFHFILAKAIYKIGC